MALKGPRARRAQVARVSLDEPLRPIAVEAGYSHVLLLVSAEGAALGEIALPAQPVLSVDFQEALIAERLGQRLWRRRLATGFTRAARGNSPSPAGDGDVSVVICTHARPDELRRCLESLLALRTSPREIVVVDNSPGDRRTREVCEQFPVTHVAEEVPGLARARNRGILESSGELIAFTDDDCVVDARWLDNLVGAFAHPLVMVVTGYVGPRELETPAQYLFQLHGGFGRSFEPMVLAGPETKSCGLGDGNAVFRRAVFEEVGLFAEDFGPGTPTRSGQDAELYYRIFAAGYRIAFDPARVVWHRNRPEYAELKRAVSGYACGMVASATSRLVRHRDPTAVRAAAWWGRRVLGDLARIARGADDRVPLALALAEARGMLSGPWRLFRSARSRGRPPSLELSPPSSEPRGRHVAVVEPADPPLSVAVASYNRRESLAAVLEALGRQNYPNDRFEVVVVLDGSSDGSAERVRGLELPYSLRLLEQENRGLSATRNRGVAEAANPVVLFLDDDIVPESSYVAEHAAAHRRSRDGHVALGYCAPVIVGHDYRSLALRGWWDDFFQRKAEPAHQWTFFDFSDGTASMPRSMFLESGGFDEQFRRGQDWDLGLRLLELGVRFGYYPAAKCSHHVDASVTTALRVARETARADVGLATKHPHVKGRLTVASYARGGDVARRQLFAHRYASAGDRLAPILVGGLHALEAMKLAPAWGRLFRVLWTQAYVAGLKDALPSLEEFRAFLGSTAGPVDALQVTLDHPSPLQLPSRQAPVDVSVAWRGLSIARVPAVASGAQWSWDALAARVAEHSSPPAVDELLEVSSGLAESDRECAG